MRSKKGSQSVEQSVLEVIFLVIFVTAAFIVGFWVMSLLSSSQQGTMESFRLLEEGIEILVSEPNATVCYEHILVDEEFMLAGFSRGRGKISRQDTGWYFDSEVDRPIPINRCPLEKSCLAICDVDDGIFDSASVAGSNDCKNEKLKATRTFDRVQSFEYAIDRFDATSAFDFGVHKDLLYMGNNNKLDFILIFKNGVDPNYVITLAKLENVENAVLDRNIVPCHSLPDLPRVPDLSLGEDLN